MLHKTDIINYLYKIFSLLEPKEVNPSVVNATGTGTVLPGASAILFANRGAATATITFQDASVYTLAVNEEINLSPGINRRLGKITYDATGTTLKIIRIG